MHKFTLTIVCLLNFYFAISQKDNISISGIPNWVLAKQNFVSDNKHGDNNPGYFYHLIDFQTNLKSQSSFFHYTIELLNNEGIQQNSDISIDFDPSYQKLVFHKVSIIRNGETIKKLSLDKIKTIQRETNMERFLYDETITAFINLTDVRIGDTLDYSYSIIGRNPIYENKYDGKIYFQYSIPIGYLHNRILIPSKRQLNFKYFNNASNAKIKNHDGLTEYSWIDKNVAPIVYDINTPSWYDPLPSVSISEYLTWNEVINQYNKHYKLTASDHKKLSKEASRLFSEIPKDSLIDKIRKFVQDDIRYLGFEGGLNSHKPSNPITVLQRRYGDCKAKSFLLSELYKIYDIEAHPTLVNSFNGKNISNDLPSPNLFNHCIVQIRFDDEIYYIDPTISNQGGHLENLYTPEYTVGLVLEKNETELSNILSTSKSTINIKEEFEINEIGGTGFLHVTTTYTGNNADNQRINFAKKNIQAIQKEYLNFYSTLYPSIKEHSKIQFIDNREYINEFIVKESYSIDSLWAKSPENDQILSCEFYPLTIESYTNLNKSPERSMPYYVQYPTDIEHQIIINLPEEWHIKQENTIVREDSFIYSYDINYANKQIKLHHTYKTLKNQIAPEEVSSFISKHEQIRERLSYILTYNKNFIGNNAGVSWVLLLMSLITIFISIYFALKIYKNYDIPTIKTIDSHTTIGGWLVLVAIGLCVTPFRMLFDFFHNFQDFFGINTWIYITQKHNSFQQLFNSVLVVFELVYNSVFIVFSVLVLLLFFRRRSIAPRMVIIFYASTFIFLTLDSLIAFGVNDTSYSEIEKVQVFKEISVSFIKAAVWIPYFIFSKRVKNTFIESYIKDSAN